MTEDESVTMYESLDEDEPNVVRPCDQCGDPDSIMRDPRQLPTKSVFAYCHQCGMTYSVLIMQQGHQDL